MKKRTKNIIAVAALVVIIAFAYLIFGGGFQQLRDGSGKPIVLEADFDQTVQEDASDSPLKTLGLADEATLQDVLAALEAGAKDKCVKVLVARIGTGMTGFAQRQDVRDAIARFRKAGKKGLRRGLLVALTADRSPTAVQNYGGNVAVNSNRTSGRNYLVASGAGVK